MNKLIGKWIDGIGYLIMDDLISFYTFFTVVFAECAYLRGHKDVSIALPFAVILFGYVVNVIVCAYIKGRCEGTKKELIISKIYVLVFAVLLLTGFLIDATLSIVVNTLLLGITTVWIGIRIYQNTDFASDFDERVQLISKLFHNPIFWIISQFIVVGGPFIAFTAFLAMITGLPVVLKVAIPVAYLICMPFIAVFEDETAKCNIFELSYRITWKKNDANNC